MATTPTNKPIPSEDPRDLKFNAGKIDEEVNGSADYYTDRFSVQRLTNTGRNNQFQIQMNQQADDWLSQFNQQESEFQQFLLNSGYQFLGDYENGPYTIAARNQIIRYQNELWRLNASTNPPYTTTGVNSTSWATDVTHLVSVGDATLRQELASQIGLYLIGSVSGINTLRNITPSMAGQAIQVESGFNKSKTLYRYDATDTTTADNGGTVIVTTGGARWKLFDNANAGIDLFGFNYAPAATQTLTAAYAALNTRGITYRGLTNDKFPGRGAKLWRETQGTLENATILSIRNATSPESDPAIPVLAVDNFATRAAYTNRDHVGMYLGMDTQDPVVTTSATTFTATSVTSADFEATLSSGRLKVGVLIDTTDSPKKTGKVTALNKATNTLTVDGWVIAGGGGATTTPSAGTGVKVNPMGGLWCANWILGLNASHDVTNAAYIMEGDIRNDKATGSGHGMYMRCADSSFACGNAFWAVGGASAHWSTGFAAQYCDTGFYVDNTSNIGFWSNNAAVGIRIRGASTALAIGTATTTYTTMDGLGTVSGARKKSATFAANATIDDQTVVAIGPTVTVATTVNLPEATSPRNLDRTLFVKNPVGSTANIFWGGAVEGG
ncbi:TPA: hypothetical protein LOL70_004765, partial [Salmonella enterica subsp. enterica serovar Infantis]|nr:hypothetical protein [Salmonella enterica subsp. enterica serovar Infantis]